MGLINKAGKKMLSGLPDLKLVSLARDVMPYISVEADGLSFFFNSTDHSILDYMVENKKIWSRDEMDYILGYYDSISVRPGNVIDIGASVGTSIVYFRKMLGSESSFYAVEPVSGNYDLLAANCCINGFHDIATFRLGISEKAFEGRMEIDPENMATCRIEGSDSNRLVFENSDKTYVGEEVLFLTLDGFVSDNKIAKERPALFWIDVEGHEPELFRGGMNTFKSLDCAVFCEFNPRLYEFNGRLDGFISDIKECFGRFLCYEQSEPGKYLFRDIAEIDKVAEEMKMNQCNLFLVK